MDSITPIKMRIKTGVLLTKSFQSDFFKGELDVFGGVFWLWFMSLPSIGLTQKLFP
ncbi:MAG: hypothetical protein ACLFQY_13140 [Desulfococcaceae bacterium]